MMTAVLSAWCAWSALSAPARPALCTGTGARAPFCSSGTVHPLTMPFCVGRNLCQLEVCCLCWSRRTAEVALVRMQRLCWPELS